MSDTRREQARQSGVQDKSPAQLRLMPTGAELLSSSKTYREVSYCIFGLMEEYAMRRMKLRAFAGRSDEVSSVSFNPDVGRRAGEKSEPSQGIPVLFIR